MHRLLFGATIGATMLVSSLSLAVPAGLTATAVANPSLITAHPVTLTSRRNVLLIILDDIGSQEIRSYANDLATATRTVSSSTGIIDTNSNHTPDGLEDTDHDGYADGAISTPKIDSRASAGVRFTNVWSNPVCSPTRAGIYTGLYATHTGIGFPVGGDATLHSLPIDIPTLAEQMNSAGSTGKKGFFGKWHLGAEIGMLPTDRGWNYFAGSLGGELNYYSWDKVVVDETGARADSTSTSYSTGVNIEDALTWIGSQSQGWWATVALNAAHKQASGANYIDPPSTCLSGAITGTSDTALFHKTLECADYYIGQLLTGMNSTTLANTTIIFVGDNGTEGAVSQVYSNDRSKGSVYQGGVHVPLIVADGSVIAGRSSSSYVSTVGAVSVHGGIVSNVTHTVDIFGTIAEIMGITPASSDAYSLVGWLGASCPVTHRTYSFTDGFQYPSAEVQALYATLADPASLTTAEAATLTRTSVKGAIRSTDYKLIYDGSSYHFYQLSNDPFEQSDLGCGSTAAAKSLRSTYVTQLRSIDSSYPTWTCK